MMVYRESDDNVCLIQVVKLAGGYGGLSWSDDKVCLIHLVKLARGYDGLSWKWWQRLPDTCS